MTELQLYKFLKRVRNEVKMYCNGEYKENMKEYDASSNDFWAVILLIDLDVLPEFVKLIGSCLLEDSGLQINLKDGYVAIDLMDIMNEFDIEPLNIFSNEEV
ncbi:MAG: hypothetical protein ACRCZM_11855 [Bacteroidales bacterium]